MLARINQDRDVVKQTFKDSQIELTRQIHQFDFLVEACRQFVSKLCIIDSVKCHDKEQIVEYKVLTSAITITELKEKID